jgi:hypothetical protein
MTPEEAQKGLEKLQAFEPNTRIKKYPDLRKIIISS